MSSIIFFTKLRIKSGQRIFKKLLTSVVLGMTFLSLLIGISEFKIERER